MNPAKKTNLYDEKRDENFFLLVTRHCCNLLRDDAVCWLKLDLEQQNCDVVTLNESVITGCKKKNRQFGQTSVICAKDQAVIRFIKVLLMWKFTALEK